MYRAYIYILRSQNLYGLKLGVTGTTGDRSGATERCAGWTRKSPIEIFESLRRGYIRSLGDMQIIFFRVPFETARAAEKHVFELLRDDRDPPRRNGRQPELFKCALSKAFVACKIAQTTVWSGGSCGAAQARVRAQLSPPEYETFLKTGPHSDDLVDVKGRFLVDDPIDKDYPENMVIRGHEILHQRISSNTCRSWIGTLLGAGTGLGYLLGGPGWLLVGPVVGYLVANR